MINPKKYPFLVYMLLVGLLIVPPVQSATVTILSEDFEGTFPGSWTVGDSNSNDGSDYWDDTSYRANGGSWSAWSADIGSQTETITVFTEDFEGSFPGDNWLAGDLNLDSGEDYWDDLSCKFYGGSWSAWSADIGDQSDCVSYDNNMQSYMIRRYLTDASGWDSATLTYYAWYEIESGYDYLQVQVTGDGGSNWYLIGDRFDGSSGWGYHSVSIPSQYLTSQFSIGFYFYSDSSVTYEGAYVDDVTLTATKTTSNSQLNQYDDNMDAYMRRTIDLTDYTSASIEFWNLMPSVEGSPYDYGQFKVNGAEIKKYDTAVTSWTKETIDLSSYVGSTVTLEWNFHSDSSVKYEGWYIDDIKVEGVLPGEITVYGYFNYWDDDSASYQPVKYAKVELWDSDVLFDDLLATSSTSSTGYYSLGPVSNSDGEGGTQDIYVKVKAEASAVTVTDINDNLYVYKTDPPVSNVPDGTYNMGSWTAPATDDGAYNIHNVIIQGYQYVDIFDTAPSQVIVKWPDTDADSTSYYSDGTIYLEGISEGEPDEWDESVILHEYGHFITDNYADLDPPTVSYCNDPGENPPNCGHSWTSQEDPETAWIEGWPDFFQSAVRDYFNYPNSDRYIETTWDVSLEFPGLEGNPMGADVEGAVASILWDIYDNNEDNFVNIGGTDTLWKDFDEIWDVYTNYDPPEPAPHNHPWNINEFWEGWFDPAFGYNERGKMNLIFWDRGIDKNNNPTVTSLDQTPTSLYRTQTFRIYAHYSDTETAEGSLTPTIEYQRPANDGWNGCTELWDSGNHRWYCDITTTTNDNQLGTWDFRTKVSDGLEESGWTYDWNTVTVSNNNPTVTDLWQSPTSLYRTSSITVYATGSDVEDSQSAITPTIEYQHPGDSGWHGMTEYWDSGNNRWYAIITTSTSDVWLGTVDFRVKFTDTDGGSSSWTYDWDAVTVNNNNPSISVIPNVNTDEDVTPPDNWIDLWAYASDVEDSDSSMTYTIISETDPSLIDCSIDSNRYIDCGIPASNQYGYSDVTVRVIDTDGGTDTDDFRVTVNPVNDPPILSGIPDKSTDEDVTPPDNFIDLYTYASDVEDTDAQLTFSIQSQSNPSLISCMIISDRYVDCGTPAQNQYGSSTVVIEVTDTGSLTDTDDFIMTVNPVNDPPTTPTTLTPTSGIYGGTNNIVSIGCSGSADVDGEPIYYNILGYYDVSWHDLELNGDGIYNWDVSSIVSQTGVDLKCNATDLTDSSAYFNPAGTLEIDNTKPVVENSSTYDITGGQDEIVKVDIWDASGIDTVLLELDATTNYTMTIESGNTYNYTISGPVVGFHNIRYYVNDTLGNMNDTVTDSFTVTSIDTPPAITIHSPPNDTITDTTPDLNFTISETANTTYAWNNEGNISSCQNCTSYSTTYGEYANTSEQNLSLALHLNENTGTAVHDDSGNGNDGTLTGPIWAPGKFASGLDFSKDEYLTIPHSDSLTFNDSFSISFWITFKEDGRSQWIISKLNGTTNWAGFHVDRQSNNKLRFMVHNATGTYSNLAYLVSNDTLYHVVLVRDKTASKLRLYLNGTSVKNTTSSITGLNVNTSKQIVIGAKYNFGNRLNATLDEALIFNRALGETEISKLFNKTLSEVQHSVTVYAKDNASNLNSTTRWFTVSIPPSINITSPPNETITDTSPDLDFTVSEPSNITYTWNTEGNISGCRQCTSYITTYGEYTNSSEQNLSLALHLNENTSTTVYDDSGNGNDGTLTGPIWAPGRFASGLDFSKDEYLTIPHSDSLTFNDSFSISFWITFKEDGRSQWIISKLNGTTNWAGFHVDRQSNNKLRFMVHNATGTYSNLAYLVSNDTLYHVVLVRDKTASKLRLYLNGTSVKNTTSSITGLNVNTSKQIVIGAKYNFGNILNATLDEALIFNRALGETEISKLFNKTLSEGQEHNVTVYAKDDANNLGSTTRWFSVVAP